jgi:hypothetical protein
LTGEGGLGGEAFAAQLKYAEAAEMMRRADVLGKR